MSSDSITRYLRRFLTGDTEAYERIFGRCFEQLTYWLKDKLRDTPTRVEDEQDVAQETMVFFAEAVQRGRFTGLKDRSELWALLLAIGTRKSLELRRRTTAAKRGGGRVRGDSAFASADATSPQVAGWDDLPGTDPPPEDRVELADLLEHLLEQMTESDLREIALRRMAEQPVQQIAEEMQIALRSVERKLRLIRERWRREYHDDR